MPCDSPETRTELVCDPSLSFEHTRTVFIPWSMPEKNSYALAERFVDRVSRHLPRGVRWHPHQCALLVTADAPQYDPLKLLDHFGFVWWEEFDLYTNILDHPRAAD